MSKRFTATEKWSDPWFCSLTVVEKLFWIYLTENCNHAGVWDVNWWMVNNHFGALEWDQKKFDGRIVPFADGAKWFLPKFIPFQYHGELNPHNRVHASVIVLLKKEGLWPLSRKEKNPLPLPQVSDPSMTHARVGDDPKDKDKTKDMDKDKDNNMPSRARNTVDCEYCGWIIDHENHLKCHYCFQPLKGAEENAKHRCRIPE